MHQFINKEQKKLEELEHLDTGDVDLQTAKEFLLASHTRLILRIKKWAKKRFIDFAKKSEEERLQMDDGDIDFMNGNNDCVDDLLKYLEE